MASTLRLRSAHVTSFLLFVLFTIVKSANGEGEVESDAGPSDVIKLTKDNFDDVISSDQLVLVKFFAPWCSHCQAMEQDFKEVATELKGTAVLADLDATVEEAIAKRYEVEGFPTLKMFSHGEVIADYNGERNKESMIKFIERANRPSYEEFSTKEQVTKFMDDNKQKNLLIGASLNEETLKNFKKSSFSLRDVMPDTIEFAHLSSTDLIDIEDLKENDVYLLKYDETKDKHVQLKYESKKTVKTDYSQLENTPEPGSEDEDDLNLPEVEEEEHEVSMDQFVKLQALPSFQEFTQDNAEIYTEISAPLIIGFFDSCEESEECKILRQVAKERSDVTKVVFAWANKESLLTFLEYVGMTKAKIPVCAYNFQSDQRFFLPKVDDFIYSKESILEWVDSIVDGSTAPERKSEPVPETQDSPLHVVVGSSWESDVENEHEHDVFIAQVADFDENCAALSPILRKLAKDFQEKGITNIRFATMEATANEATEKYKAEEDFPLVHFFKKGSSDGVLYEGKRTAKDIVQFLLDNASDKFDFDIDSLGPDPTPDELDEGEDVDLGEHGLDPDEAHNFEEIYNDEEGGEFTEDADEGQEGEEDIPDSAEEDEEKEEL